MNIEDFSSCDKVRLLDTSDSSSREFMQCERLKTIAVPLEGGLDTYFRAISTAADIVTVRLFRPRLAALRRHRLAPRDRRVRQRRIL